MIPSTAEGVYELQGIVTSWKAYALHIPQLKMCNKDKSFSHEILDEHKHMKVTLQFI